MQFTHSDLGAKAAWKGYTSQTLYIASRIVSAQDDSDFYPEQLEDLTIKLNGQVDEVVQIKDLTSSLTISDLASSESSAVKNEGFFRRFLSLRDSCSNNLIARIIHFGPLGEELTGLSKKNEEDVYRVKSKLVKKHKIIESDVDWILERLEFEKVDKTILESFLIEQISQYLPAMLAPKLVRDLLIHYISELSANQEHTSKAIWQEKNNAHWHRHGSDGWILSRVWRCPCSTLRNSK